MTRAAYSMALKQHLIARLADANAPSAAQLARETGIRQQNLSRWLNAAQSPPLRASGDPILASWTVLQKARIIVQAAGLTADQLSTYLESEGVTLSCFRRWRRALEEAREEPVGMTKRNRLREEQLTRKRRSSPKQRPFWCFESRSRVNLKKRPMTAANKSNNCATGEGLLLPRGHRCD